MPDTKQTAERPIEDVEAGNAFRESIVSRADCDNHGEAGIDYARGVNAKVIGLTGSASRQADFITDRLSQPRWRPMRSDIEEARNTIRRLVNSHADMRAALEELRELFEDKQDVTVNGGPNDAMRAVQIIEAALKLDGSIVTSSRER